jgi:hypothetical protein
MSYTFVSITSGNTGTATTTGSQFTGTITTTQGNTLICALGYAAAKIPGATISDSLSNVWNSVGGLGSELIWAQVSTNVAAGTCTVTVSGTGSLVNSGAFIIAQYAPSVPQQANHLFQGFNVTAAGTTVVGTCINGPLGSSAYQAGGMTIMNFALSTATASLPWTVTGGTSRGTGTFSTTVSLNLTDSGTIATPTWIESLVSTASGTTATTTLYCMPLAAVGIIPPGVNVTSWNGTAVATPNVGGVPKVDVVDWLGTAVTSAAGVPIVSPSGGTITTVTGTVAAVTTCTTVGTVTSTVTATVPTVTQANVTQWLGLAPATPNIGGVPIVDVGDWLGTAVTSDAGVPITTNTHTFTATVPSLSTNVNVQQWLGTAVTSQAGIPIVYPTGGTIATVTGTVAAVTTASNVGTVTAVTSATVVGTPTVNVVDWLGTAVTSNAGVPVVDVAGGTITTVTGNVLGTVAAVTTATGVGTATLVLGGTIGTATVVSGTVTTVSGNVGGSVGSVVGTVTATVPTEVSANVTEWLGTAVTSNAGVPVVDVAAGTVTTVTGNVLGTVAAVTTATAVGTVGTVTGAVTISAGQLTVKKDQALAGFTFPMYNNTGTLTTGLTVTAQESVDGGAIGFTTNSPSEIGDGIYKIDLAAGDLNGTVITLLFSASGAATTIVTLITQV